MSSQGRTVPLVNEKYIHDARPEPKPGHPYLQSARLSVPMAPPRLQKGMLQKVKQLLSDLGLAPRPLPTKTVCDLYDALRRDMVELFTVQKLGRQREALLEGLKGGGEAQEVFGRQAALGVERWEGGAGAGGYPGGGAVRMGSTGSGGGGGGGGGQKKMQHRKGQSSMSRQHAGGGGMYGQAGLAHAGSESSLSGAEDRKRKRP